MGKLKNNDIPSRIYTELASAPNKKEVKQKKMWQENKATCFFIRKFFIRK